MRTLLKMIATMFASCLVFYASAQTSMDYNILIEDIEFQPGVTININVNVYVNENAEIWANHGKIFAIEGMAHTANCWKPFAEELFANGPQGAHLNEFYAIDMPGRGGSGFPQGWNPISNDVFKLADMYFEDYLAVIQGTLNYLVNVHGVKPNTIMGHSLGGLEVILFQDMLVQQGTNLREEFGIKNAILLAPAIPAPLPWAFLGTGAAQLIPMAIDDPDHGWILNIPYYTWPWLFFTNTCCYFPPGNPYGYPPSMVPGAPDAATVLANGYNSIEAGPLLFHMGGLPLSILDPDTHHPTRPRISASAGIFKPQHGVQLTIFADEFDKMMSPEEEWALYQYLTDDKHGKGYLLVEGEETCHDTHISDPHALVVLLNNPNFFKSAEMIDHPRTTAEFGIYPNPTDGMSHMVFDLPEDAHITIKVYNCIGQQVAVLADNLKTAGVSRSAIDLTHLQTGIYFIRFEAGQEQQTIKLIKK